MLLQLSQFYPLCPPPSSTPHSLGWSPHLCSCLLVIRTGSLATPFPVLYFMSPCYSVTTDLYFFILSPLHPFPWTCLPSGNCQNSLHPWFCLCSCLLSSFFRFNCWKKHNFFAIFCSLFLKKIFLIYLLIMLLQLSHFRPFTHSPPIVHVHGSYL